MAIVRWCLSPYKIDQLKFEEFYQMVTTCNRGIRQYRRLHKIWEIAPYSIGCQPGTALDLEAKVLVDNINQIKEQIKEVDNSIKDLCQSYEEYEYLQTIPGFGPYISAVVLAAIGNHFDLKIPAS